MRFEWALIRRGISYFTRVLICRQRLRKEITSQRPRDAVRWFQRRLADKDRFV